MLKGKLQRLKQRHGQQWVAGLLAELLAKCMRKPLFRRALTALFPQAEPRLFVFMTGCYNSGTTIIKDAICLHPAISSPPVEGSTITTDLLDFEAGMFPRAMFYNVSGLALAKSHRINVKRYKKEIWLWWKGKTVFLDKSISNTAIMGNIVDAFPNARVINVIRNPEATISGIIKKSSPSVNVRHLVGEVYSDKMLKKQWRSMYQHVLNTPCDRKQFLNVSFERFLSSPEGVVAEVWSFLGLPACEVKYDKVSQCLVVNDRSIQVKATEAGTSNEEYQDLLQKLETKAGLE